MQRPKLLWLDLKQNTSDISSSLQRIQSEMRLLRAGNHIWHIFWQITITTTLSHMAYHSHERVTSIKSWNHERVTTWFKPNQFTCMRCSKLLGGYYQVLSSFFGNIRFIWISNHEPSITDWIECLITALARKVSFNHCSMILILVNSSFWSLK